MVVAYSIDYSGEVGIDQLIRLKRKIGNYISSNEVGDNPAIQRSAVILANPGIPPCGYVLKPTLVIEIKLGTKNPTELYAELTALLKSEGQNDYVLEIIK